MYKAAGVLMSMGYYGKAELISSDESETLYTYGCMNLNGKNKYPDGMILDGSITINKSCIPEPDIHEKIRRMPSGMKKLVAKVLPKSVDIGKCIDNGSIEVSNSKNCWKFSSNAANTDWIAVWLIEKIITECQLSGAFPETMGFAS